MLFIERSDPWAFFTLFHFTACLNNTYGAECLKICGQCLSEQQCNHINGTCTIGCETGYYSDHCKIGIVLALTLTYFDANHITILAITKLSIERIVL